MARSSRIRRLLLLVAALVVAGVLVAPVLLTRQQRGASGTSCEPTLRYLGRVYEFRSVAGKSSVATGVGVLSGCGRPAANVNVRSLIGIRPARAVGIEGTTDLYVRTDICAAAVGAALVRCLAQ